MNLGSTRGVEKVRGARPTLRRGATGSGLAECINQLGTDDIDAPVSTLA